MVAEIFLTKKSISSSEWVKFVHTISDYNGFLNNFNIIVVVEKGLVRYFVECDCTLPATINNLDGFILKSTGKIGLPKAMVSLPFFGDDKDIINIVDYFKARKKGHITCFQFKFMKYSNDKIHCGAYLFYKKRREYKYKKILNCSYEKLLTVNFDNNKSYFYKKSPKYLDITKSLHLLKTDKANALLKVDTFPYLQGDFYLDQLNYDFNKHSVIFGSSGCGKSKFISLLIKNICKNRNLREKYKVVVIDPHAALENDIGGIGRVIDFKTVQDSIDLFVNKNGDAVSSTELLLDLFKTLISDQYNSKLERVLRHSIYLLLSCEKFNFTNLRKLLTEIDYRNELINSKKGDLPDSIVSFFLTDFSDLKTKSYSEAISPIIGFIDEMEMLPVFNNQQSSNNIESTVNRNFLTLFSLDSTRLGNKVTKMISGLVMQQILTMIQSYAVNKHIIFIIDEVAVVENPILCRFLSEARKYNLSLILAGQYFNQISSELKSSIFANVVNYYIFRVSRLDAEILADNFNIKIPLDDTKEYKVKLLSELNNRELVLRIANNGILLPAMKAKTLDYASIPRAKQSHNNSQSIPTNNHDRELKRLNFSIGSSVNLKDVMKKNSSSRKVVE